LLATSAVDGDRVSYQGSKPIKSKGSPSVWVIGLSFFNS
jgi:hypothetical protein